MGENFIEKPLMSMEDMKSYLQERANINSFSAISKFKSINRAVRRGLVTPTGFVAPKRPFNNRANSSKRKNTHSRRDNELKKKIYEQIQHC